MPKKITIWYEPDAQQWVILLSNSPVMGESAWQYDTWAECMIHAKVLIRVWDHL